VMREAVLDLKRKGTTVIFSTHDMEAAEKMCDLIFMIHQGKKVLDGPLETIQDTYGSDTVKIQLQGDTARLDDLPGVLQITDFGRWHELRLARHADAQGLLEALMRRGRVLHFEVKRPSLRDVFVRIVGQKHAEASPVQAN